MTTAIFASLIAISSSGAFSPAKPAGFLAQPKSGYGSGVLVLHPWWGLNGDVKETCRRLASAGFTAFAPDLFHGKTATTPAAAEALVKEFNSKEKERRDQLWEAAKYLEEKSGRPQYAVIGLSFGAYYALDLSNADPHVKAVIVFYGTGPADFSKSKASYLGHFASNDDFEPKANVDGLAKAILRARRPVKIYTYPGTGHWFFEPSVKKAYNKAAADLAWSRTLRFLKDNFVGK